MKTIVEINLNALKSKYTLIIDGKEIGEYGSASRAAMKAHKFLKGQER